jgi:hypothetical protein
MLLGVKRWLLGLHALYQFLDPIKRSLIGDPGWHSLVMLDLAVEFDALLTHWRFHIRAKLAAIIDHCLADDWKANLFTDRLRTLLKPTKNKVGMEG